MAKPLISLCMIVKNEADVIANCLRSAQEAADEMIVVDTGSTDETAAIARRAGAKVYSREWRQDFAAARNESLELARGKWILVMDADEWLSDGHAALLRRYVADNPAADGIFVRIRNYVGAGDKHAGSSVSSALRLFRNKRPYRYEGRIHEQIVQPILTANPAAKLLFSDIEFQHGGYLPEVVRRKNKVERNMTLLQQELRQTDSESFHRYNLGVEYIRSGDCERALEQFRLSRGGTDLRQSSFGHIVVLREINCLQALGRFDEAIALSGMATEAFPDYPDLFLNLGRIHYHLRQWEKAEVALLQALAIGEAPPRYTSVSGAGTYGASFHLGKTYEQSGNFDRAASQYASTLKTKPDLLPPFLRLVSVLARNEEAGTVTEKLERLFLLELPSTCWSIAVSYYQLGLYEQAAGILRTKPMPDEKRRDRLLLLARCRLLSERPERENDGEASGEDADSLKTRIALYEAFARNDDRAAAERLAELAGGEAPQQDGKRDDALALLRSLYAHLVDDDGASVRPDYGAASPQAVASLWSELSFLYMLAAKKRLFALQSRVQAYWQHAIAALADPALRLKGLHELIKTVHVRIYSLFPHRAGDSEYAAVWSDVKANLTTLIDDLLLEELL